MSEVVAPQGRKTIYAGIEMRSRLEADYAGHLDREEIKWEYEPACFAGPDGQWLPDFRRHESPWMTREVQYDGETVPVYTEIKPVSFADHLICPHLTELDGQTVRVGSVLSRHHAAIERFAEQHLAVEALLRRMAMAWLSEEEAVIELVFWEYGLGGAKAMIVGKRGTWRCYNLTMGLWDGVGQGPTDKFYEGALVSRRRSLAQSNAVSQLTSLLAEQEGGMNDSVVLILSRMVATLEDVEFNEGDICHRGPCHRCTMCGGTGCYVYGPDSLLMEAHWCDRCGHEQSKSKISVILEKGWSAR